jgi:hypothetical protein
MPNPSQDNELSRVKARIRALAERTVSNGCTEAEAMAAADMVGRLLERYALSMEEIDLREARCVQVEVPLPGRQRRPIDGCVPAIARFCDCKVWLARDPGPNPPRPRYVFFGFETDTALAAYLYQMIDRAMEVELELFRAKRTGRLRGVGLRQATTGFQQGMAARLAVRLEAMHTEREAGVAAQRSAGTALMLVKHRVVEDAFRETGTRLVSGGQRSLRQGDAFRQGEVAGEKVNLNRPVTGSGSSQIE